MKRRPDGRYVATRRVGQRKVFAYGASPEEAMNNLGSKFLNPKGELRNQPIFGDAPPVEWPKNLRPHYLRKNHPEIFEIRERLRMVWKQMKARCTQPTNRSYECYGGAGVKVCDEWLPRFEPFFDWARRSGYRPGLSIDRIDPYGNYEPGNCRWIPKAMQPKTSREHYDAR